MDTRRVYENLTSVNIEEQERLWDSRGKGYYGEYMVFNALYHNIRGNCKILMNLEIPSVKDQTTEIDLLMIHETGLYIFEVKHYKGTIYGSYQDENWTQYFRTQENSHFYSPIKQNEYHRAFLRNMFPGMPIYSAVVFTNNEATLHITGRGNSDVVLCSYAGLFRYINDINSLRDRILSEEDIDNLFQSLQDFSPMKKDMICEDGQALPMSAYVNIIKDNYANSLEAVRREERSNYKRKVTTAWIVAAAVCAAFLGIVVIAALVSTARVELSKNEVALAQEKQLQAEKELADFKRKFMQVDPMNGANVVLKGNFYEAYDIEFKESEDLQDTITFSSKIKINGTKYGIRINGDSAIIVQMKDGTVREYVFANNPGSFYVTYWIGPFPGYYNTFELPSIDIYTDSVDNIAYIKLTNIPVCAYGNDMNKDFLPGTEFELYSAK